MVCDNQHPDMESNPPAIRGSAVADWWLETSADSEPSALYACLVSPHSLMLHFGFNSYVNDSYVVGLWVYVYLAA